MATNRSDAAERQDDPWPLVAGALTGIAAGLAASFLMAEFEHAWKPPKTNEGESATTRTARMLTGLVTDAPLTVEQAKRGGTLVHYALGAGLGLIYGIAAERGSAVTAGGGLAFGVATELAIDQALVPALGLSKPFWQCPAKSHLNGLAAHLVFGTAAEATRRLTRSLLATAVSQEV